MKLDVAWFTTLKIGDREYGENEALIGSLTIFTRSMALFQFDNIYILLNLLYNGNFSCSDSITFRENLLRRRMDGP